MKFFFRDKHLRRLLRYTLKHPVLLTAVIASGVAGFCVLFAFPWLIGSAIDTVIYGSGSNSQRLSRLWFLVFIGMAAAATHALVGYARGHYTVRLGDTIVARMRRDLFEHLQQQSLKFYFEQRTGSIMNRLLHDVHNATAIIYGGIIVVGVDALQLLVAIVLLAFISWKLTLACMVVLPCYLLTFRLFNPRVRRASAQLHEHYGYFSGNVQEQLSGIALTQSYANERFESEKFGKDVEDHHKFVLKQSHSAHLVGAVSEFLVHVGTVIVFGYGAFLALHHKPNGDPELTVGEIVKFLGYLGIMYGPLRRFADLNVTYQNSLSAIERIFSLFDIKPAIQDRPRPAARSIANGAVRFDHVRFRYDNDKPWVIDGVTLHASPGERIALVGPSGSGKSTLVSLLPRTWDVTQGRITIDGVDVRDHSLRGLRRSIGVVHQDTFIFSGSIRSNLTYGRPDRQPCPGRGGGGSGQCARIHQPTAQRL